MAQTWNRINILRNYNIVGPLFQFMLSDKRKPVKIAVLSCATLSKSLHRMIAIANAIEGIRNRIL